MLNKINKSAKYAIEGIIGTFKEEFMMRVQFSFGLIQFLLAIILHLELTKIIIIFLIWMLLFSLENMNTAVENITDYVMDGKNHYLAKRAKDSAGASVFIISVASWIIFILLVVDNILV